jgi:hypothetical protein
MSKKVKNFSYVSGKRYDGMMGRCYRESDHSFKNYGAKNIRVCKLWIEDIGAFRAWILSELDTIGMDVETFLLLGNKVHLDRIDINGHYSPDNCRLVSIQANSRNKNKIKNKVIISAEGEHITLGEIDSEFTNKPMSIVKGTF